ncbi:MAG: hypothetical protein AAF226_08890, partial [Verrucomicrobiota bacterium]
VGQHRVSVYGMEERVGDPLPPLKGQGNIQRVIDFATGLEFGGMTNLEECFRTFQPSRQRYGIIFVISDLYGQGVDEAKEAIRHASGWPGEVHFIQIYHPWEEKPDLDGEIELIDVESNEQRRLWFTRRDRRRYEARYQQFMNDIAAACQARQIDYQPWRTDLPFEDVFLEMLSRGSALASGN